MQLNRRRAVINYLDFYNPPNWLAEIFGKSPWLDDDGMPLNSYSTFVSVPPEFAEWLRADYTRRFNEALAQLRAGVTPEHYSSLWYYEFCEEAGINCWDRPSSEELVAALSQMQ